MALVELAEVRTAPWRNQHAPCRATLFREGVAQRGYYIAPCVQRMLTESGPVKTGPTGPLATAPAHLLKQRSARAAMNLLWRGVVVSYVVS